MRKLATWVIGAGCLMALVLTCFGAALFADRQFGYRDSAQYYYPLYQRVQQEWDAGRWPLWEPEENAGMPLMGNPTAAVLYPGKLVFAILPYAWAARTYIVMHVVLAFVAMLVLMRSWPTSWEGSTLSALSYSFGAPILFQYSNVIYLVGAAWLPLAFHAVDRWVRRGRRWGLVELAVVLAMQILGGDPQSAYLAGWAAGGYALGIAWSRARARRCAVVGAYSHDRFHARARWLVPLTVIALVIWVVATLALAIWLPLLRPPGRGVRPLSWMAHIPRGVIACWGVAALGFLVYAAMRRWRSALARAWLGLALAAGLAAAVAAAQLLPSIEFTQQSIRASTLGSHDLYRYSLDPFRLIEMVWPNIQGNLLGGNTYWRDLLKIPGCRPELWVESLYLGGLTVALACGAWATRPGPAGRVWLSVIVAAGLAASLGQYASPVWAARFVAQLTGSTHLRALTPNLGPHDPLQVMPIRYDGFLRDGDGGVYWWLATILPGFRQFRFPAKLFTFTALGLTALAGLGWDQVCAGDNRKTSRALVLILVSSLAVLAAVGVGRPAILSAFRGHSVRSGFGPFDAEGAYRAIVASLTHASIVAALGLAAVRLARTLPWCAGIFAMVVMTADLAVANARYVVTVPQQIMETKPEALRVIEDAERQTPAGGPFRVYRMASWQPRAWETTTADNRADDFVAWGRDTLEPKFGINLGVEYTHAFGVGGLFEYERFFGDFPVTVRTTQASEKLGVEPGQWVVYHPRRAFDLWNTRYFVVPANPRGWREEYRGYASFVFDSDVIYPRPEAPAGPDLKTRAGDWLDRRDFQVLRNRNQLPRSWVVHEVRYYDRAVGAANRPRDDSMREILYGNDPLWREPSASAHDPRVVAWADRRYLNELAPYLSGRRPRSTEAVTVTHPTPHRTELDVTLESAGLVILAEVYYPGWSLTIDGTPAPIYPVNHLMRGADVSAGRHHLVYAYDPLSFHVGQFVSAGGLLVLVVLAAALVRHPVDRILDAGA